MTTITPEERAQWRKESRAEYAHFSQDGRRLMRALDALEAAEARAEKTEAERDVLAERVVDDNGKFFGGFDFEDAPVELSRAEAKGFVLAWAAQEVAKQAAEKKEDDNE